MGFLLKILFIYFLIKFIWSISKGTLLKKLQALTANLIQKKMRENADVFSEDDFSSSNNRANGKTKMKNQRSSDTFEAEYKVLKK